MRKGILCLLIFILCIYHLMNKNNELPNVSIIVPVYNVENYLPKCLDSLKRQTLQNIEFIVINDGSTDNSYRIMQEYAKNDKRFKIFKQENKGVGKTRNLGIELAKGEYIGFVDSDDYVSSNYFEKLYNIAKKHNADVGVVFNVMKIYGNHIESSNFPYPKFEVLDDFSFLVGNAGQQWDKIYKKSFLIENDIKSSEDKVWFEDEWFSTLVALYAHKIVMTDETIYYYRYNPAGLSASFRITKDDFLKGLTLYNNLLTIINKANFDEERAMRLRQRILRKIEWFNQTYGNVNITDAV